MATHLKNQRGIALLAIAALLGVSTAHVLADGKKKKNTAQTSAPATQQTAYDSTVYSSFAFPQFYTYWPINNNDTILRYECYDADGNYLNMDTISNIMNVQHIYFTKTHLDYTQTIIDAEGKPRPQPVTKRLYKYDRISTDSWAAYDLVHHYASTLLEYRDNIVRTDTTIIADPITNTQQVTIRRYYKVTETEKSEENGMPPTDTTTATDATDNRITEKEQRQDVPLYVYTVPEFYFYVAKRHKDTTLEFLCYDYRDSLMNNVTNYDSVHFYSLFKSYTDSAHTYTDSNGEKKLLPVSSIIKRYDRISSSKWMSVEYPKNKYQELREYKDVITRSDSITVIDPINEKAVLKVFNYYKVVK